ncbi:MAG: hypothetical protein LQ343_002615 [Gyalolechia ehrenbergii]|nr:MAG: hypothetical protein LQ343_002615 [Gyalolechia ehrenbergii]
MILIIDDQSTSPQIAPEEFPLPKVGPPTPSAPQAPPPLTAALPLTAENLQRLPGSPPRHAESDSTMPSGKKGTGSTSSDDNDIYKAHKLLDQHGMFLVKTGEKLLPPAVAEAVRKAMSASFDEMRPSSAQKIITNFAKNFGRNETTNFIDFWMRMYKHTSKKKDVTEPGKLMDSDWDDQGLDINFDQFFEETGVSVLKWEDPEDQKLIDGLDNVKRPKPDAVFGIRETAFTERQMKANMLLQRWAGVSKGTWHLSGLVEYKGDNGLLALAMIQALRAGSTLVAASRSMMEQAGMLKSTTPGVDAANIIFSFCITPACAFLYVHWAVVSNDPAHHTRYYMQEVERYWPDKEEGLRALRQAMERIYDWGTLERLNGTNGVKDMLDNFMNKPNKQSKHTEGSSAGAASREGEGKGKGK